MADPQSQLPTSLHPTLQVQMDYSLTKTLEILLLRIIRWIDRSGKVPWRTSTSNSEEQSDEGKSVRQFISDLEIVRDHAAILDIRLFMETERRSQTNYANLELNIPWRRIIFRSQYSKLASQEERERKKWMSFLEDLKELFKVPKLNHPMSVLVGSFMDFLLELLVGKPHLFAFEPDLIITELRSFITIFHDTPFQTTENDGHVHTLLSQFEILANEAGILVHSFIFSPHPPPSKKIDELLSEPITLLKANVIQFFNSPSYISTTPNTLHFAMSSVFIVNSLLYDLENLINRKDDSILEIKDDVEKLHRSLKHSWSLLSKHSNKTDEVKEIVLLAFATEYLICGDVLAWYLALRLPVMIHNVELIGTRLQEMVWENNDVDRVLDVGDDFARLSLETRIDSGVDDHFARLSLQTRIDSRVDDPVDGFKYEEPKILDTVVGFDDEELKILGELVGGGNGLQIISIIGMAGIGKTTLAKKMHNHPTVKDGFDRISWCTVSQEYKTKRLLVDILMGLDSQVKKATVMEEREDDVGLRIYKTLKGRRYFVVVDDIWESSAWEDIKRYFPDDGNCSRILFTSRNKEVADPYNSSIHALPLLSCKQCWELLEKKVFHGESCPPELQHMGETIAAQCSGLPLVVVVVAGILSTIKKDLSAWENVKRTLDSYIMSHQEGAVGKSLELSYMYLPHHLKPCFLYFGRFREDEKIRVKRVMQLWIAEGFIIADEKKRVEDTAKEYLKELIDRSLLIVVEKNYAGQAKVCTMHDLLHDMCLKIVKDDNFMEEVERSIDFFNHQVQRLMWKASYDDWFRDTCFYNHQVRPMMRYVRSFVCYGDSDSNLNVGPMKLLRVLDAQELRTSYLVGIQNLVNLRYLAVREMSESTGRFSRLEFLIVRGYIHISSSLLDGMAKLRYLRAELVYVNIECNTSSTYNLEYISDVVISNQKEEERLKAFPHVRRLKCTYKNRGWYACGFGSLTQLESLSVFKAPIIGIKLLKNIIKLSLCVCAIQYWEQMSIIGALPNLEVLKLFFLKINGEKWKTRDDEFQKLKYLKLESMWDLVEWDVSSWEHFPVLQQLIIISCPKLKEISSEIGDISTLQLISVSYCGRSLKESLIKIEEQLKEEGNEDVTIMVKDVLKSEDEDERMVMSEDEDERMVTSEDEEERMVRRVRSEDEDERMVRSEDEDERMVRRRTRMVMRVRSMVMMVRRRTS